MIRRQRNRIACEDCLSLYLRTIKINVAFGYILKDGVDGPLKFFHPSNNSKIFDIPKRIDDGGHIEELLDNVQYREAVAHAKTQRLSKKWLLYTYANCVHTFGHFQNLFLNF